MISTEQILLLHPYENEILELIDMQLSGYQNTDGIDQSMTQSDLQGAIQAIVLNVFNEGKNFKEKK